MLWHFKWYYTPSISSNSSEGISKLIKNIQDESVLICSFNWRKLKWNNAWLTKNQCNNFSQFHLKKKKITPSLLLLLSNQVGKSFNLSLFLIHQSHPVSDFLSLSFFLWNMSNYTVESTKVETSDGAKLHTRLFKPIEEGDVKDNLVIVLVHPFSILGGCQALLKGIAAGLAEKGYKAVTFDMRGAGKSTGRASLTGFSEIKDVIAVCKWVCENLSSDRILLVGSSAGMCFIWFDVIWFVNCLWF